MILAFCTIILAAAVISGIFAGRATNKKTLFICGGIMLAAALLTVTMAFICCDMVIPQDQFRYLHKIEIDPFKNSFWSRIITECRLFTHLISLNFISACTLFLLSFNSFRYLKSLRRAFITLILFIIGNFLLFLPIFSTCFIWCVWVIPCKTDFFSLSYGEVVLYAAYCTFVILLLFSVDWTVNFRRRKLYQTAVLYAAAGLIFYVAGILTVLNGQRLMNKKAQKLNIEKMTLLNETPPEYELLRHNKFYQEYPLYSPPFNGVYNWERNEIGAERKKFTLEFFDSQIVHDLILDHEKIVSAIGNHKDYFLGTAQTFRILTRTYCERAYLFRELKKEEKIIPELMRYIDLDKKITAQNPWLINFLVLTACRNIWFNAVIKYAPEKAEYAHFYRKMLDFSKSWQVHLPHEAGFYLGLNEYENLRGAVRFYCKPLLITVQCRGFFHILKIADNLKELEKQQSFKVITGMFASAAYRQRINITEGQILFALKCFRAENGAYPEKLEQLVPQYLEKIPLSPTTDYPIFYRKDSDGFVLDIKRIEL